MLLFEFTEKIEKFISFLTIEKNVSHHTIRAYRTDLKQFTEFWEQSITPAEQTQLSLRQIIERYLVSLFYKKIDKSSIARKFSCFKSFERYLEQEGIYLKLHLKRPRLDKKLPVYLSVEEISHLLDAVKDTELPTRYPLRDKAILELLYATGIRCSELVNIRFGDIDMNEKTIRIKGKGNKERIVLFGKQAALKLSLYLQQERPHIQRAEDFLLLNYRNEPLTSRSVQRIIAMFRPFLKIDRPISPHKIRHTFATHLLNQGVDLRVVQELLGHQAVSSTEKYTHVSLEELTTMCNEIHPINDIIQKRQQK